MNLTMTPSTKHCQAGVGHLWDQFCCGESSGEEGAGEEEGNRPRACLDGRRPPGSYEYDCGDDCGESGAHCECWVGVQSCWCPR